MSLRCLSHPANYFKLHDIQRHECKDAICSSLELRLIKELTYVDDRNKADWVPGSMFHSGEDIEKLKNLQVMLMQQHDFTSQYIAQLERKLK